VLFGSVVFNFWRGSAIAVRNSSWYKKAIVQELVMEEVSLVILKRRGLFGLSIWQLACIHRRAARLNAPCPCLNTWISSNLELTPHLSSFIIHHNISTHQSTIPQRDLEGVAQQSWRYLVGTAL